MAVVLLHRRKLLENFLSNVIRRNDDLTALLAAWLGIVAHIFLQPDFLKELCKGHRDFKWIANSCDFPSLAIVLIDEVVSQLVNAEKTLQARVQVAEVWVVLKANYAIWEHVLIGHLLLHLFLFFDTLSHWHAWSMSTIDEALAFGKHVPGTTSLRDVWCLRLTVKCVFIAVLRSLGRGMLAAFSCDLVWAST